MTHAEIHAILLHPAHRTRLLAEVEAQGVRRVLQADRVEVTEVAGLNHLHFHAPASDAFSAMTGGVFISLAPWADLGLEGEHYLLYTPQCEGAGPSDLGHEQVHLRDIVALLATDPSFVRRASSVGINAITEASQIEASIEFEVFKVFHLEPRAFRWEFANGRRHIDMPFLFGMWIRFQCGSEEDFVATHLASYVTNLERAFLKRFPEEGERIARCLRVSTDVHGAEVFGSAAYEAARSLDARLHARIMGQFHAGAEFVRRHK